MGCNKAYVSNIEHGRPTHRMNDRHAQALDEHFQLGHHFRRMLRYARAGHSPDWFKAHVIYEQRASVIKTYEALVVPGLLQTPSYARALLSANPASDVDTQVELRMSRQAILTKQDAPDLWVIVSQNALEWPVGSDAVMREQLERLLELAGLPNVTIRALPRSVRAHIGLEGSFKVITVKEGDVVYIEACGGGRTTLDLEEAAERRVRFDRIGADALSRSLTVDLIRQELGKYG
jgi:hypothetical protein